jgi:hypothetical protein
VWEKKFPNALEIVQQKFSLNAPKPPHKKGFKNSFQTKENQKRPTTCQVGFSKFQPFT